MSGYAQLRQRTQEAAAPQVDETRCHAEHCPCRGTISLEGGRFCCTAHAFAKPDDWRRITEKLREHAWLVAFTDDVQRIERNRQKDVPDWRTYATKFWTDIDAHCLPHAQEDAIPYQNRMRGELLYRLGLMKRPAPRLPQPMKGRGNAGALFGKRKEHGL